MLRRFARALARVTVGLLVGLLLAEVAFWVRDGGAFPHVNLYEADATLGTRLAPGTTQRLAFTGNPATTVRINSAGFRGDDWPAPTPDEVVMVGDSQVFGLGVEEADTIATRLATHSGRHVINAGVPTYGPPEYLAVARRLMQHRKSAEFVLVFNASNDFFELDRPNVERHVVWDGWAVRAEHGPGTVTSFPGRRWLFSQSHLVFALRQLWIAQQRLRGDSESLAEFHDPLDPGLPSEGFWSELVTAGERYDADAAEDATRGRAQVLAVKDRLGPMREALATQRRAVDEASLGEVLRDTGAEVARPVPVTAAFLARAAARQAHVKARAPLEALRKATHALDEPRWDLPAPIRTTVAGEALLAELAQFQREVGPVTVVVLPLDVQVSKSEWAKYGASPIDMGPSLELNRAFAAAAVAQGLRTVDAFTALAAAEPNAFLLGDLHLTPKGTDAVAKAIATALREPRPDVPLPGLPDGSSALPSPVEWANASDAVVRGLPSGCDAKQVREWLRVSCAGFQRIGQSRGVTRDVQLLASRRGVSAIVPVRPDLELDVDFGGEPDTLRLSVSGGAATMTEASPRDAAWVPLVPEPVETCFTEFIPDDEVPWGQLAPNDPCLALDDCTYLLACLQGHPHVRRQCGPNEGNTGVDARCARRCATDAGCRGGRCEAWQGVRTCVTPL